MSRSSYDDEYESGYRDGYKDAERDFSLRIVSLHNEISDLKKRLTDRSWSEDKVARYDSYGQHAGWY